MDLRLDGEDFDSIDRNAQNTGQHERNLGDRGRAHNAGFREWCLPARFKVQGSTRVRQGFRRRATRFGETSRRGKSSRFNPKSSGHLGREFSKKRKTA
jgi:hypothetical protein